MTVIERRRQLLNSILSLDSNYKTSRSMLQQFPFDCDDPVIHLTKGHIKKAIEKSWLDETIIIDWANFIEMRDDIGLDPADVEIIRKALFEFANLEISGRTITDLLEYWSRKL